MKLLYFLVLLSLSKIIKSEPVVIQFLSIHNLTSRYEGQFLLDGYFDYRNSDYYTTDKNISEYCLAFGLVGDVLQYTCHTRCFEVSFESRFRINYIGEMARGMHTIGFQHCPMGGIITNVYFKKPSQSQYYNFVYFLS